MDLRIDPQTDPGQLFAEWMAPLVGYVIQIFCGRFLPRKGDWLLLGGMGFTAVITVYMAAKAIAAAYAGEPFFHHSGHDAGLWFSWLYSSAEAAGIGGEPVDVSAREAGVLDRRQTGVQRQLQRIAVQAPADIALAAAGDRRATLKVLHQARSGSKSGIQTCSR